ncbi:MAG: HAD family hydrolase [Verrucomicrobiota bacterium]|nr:HAD family hydrolase [Verrucomicrobiota bacterium]
MMDSSRNERSPAVFLDRDGTIMRDVNYCSNASDVHVFPGVAEALRRLKAAGFKIIVITNQSGIGRGYFREADYRAVELELERQLGPGLIDASYFCPDAPDAGSKRRKPEPAMIFEAQRDHELDLARSFFVGDKEIDAQCGRNAGVRTIVVQTGAEEHKALPAADAIAQDFAQATEIILGHAL